MAVSKGQGWNANCRKCYTYNQIFHYSQTLRVVVPFSHPIYVFRIYAISCFFSMYSVLRTTMDPSSSKIVALFVYFSHLKTPRDSFALTAQLILCGHLPHPHERLKRTKIVDDGGENTSS